jgi:hypothetical protein
MGTCIQFFIMIVVALLAGPHGTFFEAENDRPMNWILSGLQHCLLLLLSESCLCSRPNEHPCTLGKKEGRDRLPGT